MTDVRFNGKRAILAGKRDSFAKGFCEGEGPGEPKPGMAPAEPPDVAALGEEGCPAHFSSDALGAAMCYTRGRRGQNGQEIHPEVAANHLKTLYFLGRLAPAVGIEPTTN